ncbi:MAG: methylated-DNA--[protein]-cysteine S-methyltransferase [Actinomycetota bacterium]|nr:methylated-DNA--[protein]-cysteine S-methyltransferase [Actinomycetota bacterium]
MDLSFVSVASDVGPWVVAGNELGVTRVYMPHESPPPTLSTPSDCVSRAAHQLKEYFEGSRSVFEVDLAETPATDFQRDVWRALRSLPYGRVATYADVAQLAGHPRAARAVGNANHANPWPVIVPCHRVVARHGLGGYGGGVSVKKFLLDLEGIDAGD